MERFLWVGLAGALGTWSRYVIGLVANRLFGYSFPYGTLAVNLVGCFLIAMVMELAASTTWVSPTLRLVLVTGFLGGLTTYSAFNYETSKLFQNGAWAAAAANFFATTGGCFVTGALGLLVARRLSA